ncbi:diguanylate cyclase (GGDEF) domain-containing protein [Acetoanaerobium noterae]|uniref:Diguanylate cyclase (GGDEF) domain-containing protein n=1 Tax=Acetoanaerobium noterae TaxID=745369 RepID=A0A1T5B1L1_9FIRM|nr:transporter substrate-binding domain-containing protein [Acetoanaerobium noterae]SKB41191.1 diguanylate cyclase (GGDEF) domain-containing protein [Acetoanaerobium noterae]
MRGGLIILKSNKSKITILLILFVIGIAGTIYSFNSNQEPDEKIFLTSEETKWLNENKDEIKIGYTTDYPPVEFLDDDKYVGISADYFKLLEKKLGIDIEMVEFDNWDELIKQAKSRKISGITAATKTPERSEYLDFTVPYILNPNVIITRKNFSENLTFEKLANTSMEILVVEGYDIIEFLNERFPKLEYKTVKTPSDGMRMVAFGEADAMIIEIMSASATIERDNITNLVVNVETPYESSLSIATRNDWPMLSTIFNKGLAQISQQERKEIEQRWMPLQKKNLFENRYFWFGLLTLLLGLSIIIIVISIWNASLKKAVKEKTKALEVSTQELLYKTYHDELTGLYNRAYFSEVLEEIQSKPLPLSIILADLNCLKITNDTFGHEAGDKLIINMAKLIQSNIEEGHIACRIGGDEMIVIMPETDARKSLDILAKIKQATISSKEEPIRPLVALGAATKINEDESFSRLFKRAEEKMYENKMDESEYTYDKVIGSFKKAILENEYESPEHYERLKALCLELGYAMNLDKEDLDALALLSDLHDIGKAGLDKEILLKDGPLTHDEWEKIKRHPELGFKIVSSSVKFSHVGKGILAHHEHWDGRGYPQGLKGEEIPLIARIFAVVEAYDVMTHKRPYKKTFTKNEAVLELNNCSGTQFDSRVAEAFINMIDTTN